MLYEYIVTAFKVVVGVVTNNRLVLASLIALGFLLLWVIFSLVFSFQRRLISNARALNQYVSRNGLNNGSGQLNVYLDKMPSEFVKGLNAYLRDRKTLPSDHIKKFESVDLELIGGVFNQNKSVIKTYINFVFSILFLLSIAILSNQAPLNGYILAEALLLPLLFLAVAKIIYYCYTAIRQHLYRVAVEEFNELLANMDVWANDNKPLILQVNEDESMPVEDVAVEIVGDEELSFEEFDKLIQEVREKEEIKKEQYSEPIVEESQEKGQNKSIEDFEIQVAQDLEQQNQEIQENVENNLVEVVEEQEVEQEQQEVEEPLQEEQVVTVEEQETEVPEPRHIKQQKEEVEEEIVAEVDKPKRGRGRPKKETPANGEIIITNDQQFEEALIRAEKLMRKNEEPLSQSQTKRIEKQIKQLLDAMSKYKDGK